MIGATAIPSSATPKQAEAIALADFHVALRRTIGDISDYVSFELSGVCITGLDEAGREIVERCCDVDADFWTVYGRKADGTANALRDYDAKLDAQDLLDALDAGRVAR